MDIAASTTAGGRMMLMYAKRMLETSYINRVFDVPGYGQVKTNAEYVYGDTDSVFFTFNLMEVDGTPIRGKRALELTIILAQEAGELASSFLKGPHDLEYEKTFMPFCLLSKKRYVGMLYETDPNKCYRKSMGIVLKRRDNAPIVKDVYGGVIDILMRGDGMEKAIEFTKESLQQLIDKKVSINKLVITKSLRSGYKNPQQIAHKVLADRIGVREPGNKPAPGSRIAFAYIVNPKAKKQGEKIETPEYIHRTNCKLDYGHYITNQIMKPLSQVLGLCIEELPQFRRRKDAFLNEIECLKANCQDLGKFREREQKLRDVEVKRMIFDTYIHAAERLKNHQRDILSMLSFGC
jgi:DNA polymerase elongation subunit (family B)